MRLLEKNPQARFLSAQDLAWALEQLVDVSATARTLARHAGEATSIVAGLGRGEHALAAAVLGAGSTRLRGTGAGDATRHSPDAIHLGISSRTGARFTARRLTRRTTDRVRRASDGEESRLFVRELAALEPVVVAGTEGAKQPFWSLMDGRLDFRAASPRSSRSQVERPSHSLMPWTAAAGRGAAVGLSSISPT